MSGLYVSVVIVYNNALQWGQASLDMFVGRSVFYYIFYDYNIIIHLVWHCMEKISMEMITVAK